MKFVGTGFKKMYLFVIALILCCISVGSAAFVYTTHSSNEINSITPSYVPVAKNITKKVDYYSVEDALEKAESRDIIHSFLLRDSRNPQIEEFENEIKSKGLVMLTEYKKNLVIEADKDRLKQVIINIISNSLKFTQKGYIKLSARVQRGKLLIIIEDSGSGIPKEKIPHIFDKFYTANEYGSATGGAGLGLNIAQTIVKLHDGNIKVDSEIGVGTTITIEL